MASEALAIQAMDAETAGLCLQLQLEDLDYISSRGKNRDGDDAQLAFATYASELEKATVFQGDRIMARSIAAAVRFDGPHITAQRFTEDTIARDHQMATDLANGRNNPGPQTVGTIAEPVEDEFLDKLNALFMGAPSDGEQGDDEESEFEEYAANTASSSAAPPPRVKLRRNKRNPNLRRCTACRDDCRFVDLARAPCGHEYCRDCLQDLLRSAVNDESLYPPRCCQQPFELQKLRLFAPLELIEEVEGKSLEYSTGNRTYCHNIACSKFIPTHLVADDVAVCESCGTRTCAVCKGGTHLGDCPEDESLRQVLDLAAQEGYQRCPGCWTLIELRAGCYHMTCRCGSQFCYQRTEIWKTCDCGQWDPVRLRQRAVELIERCEPGNNCLDPTAQVAVERALGVVEERMRTLEENHNCEHRRWNKVDGPHTCEECAFRLHEYIFECRQCQIRVCNHCRRNRL